MIITTSNTFHHPLTEALLVILPFPNSDYQLPIYFISIIYSLFWNLIYDVANMIELLGKYSDFFDRFGL